MQTHKQELIEERMHLVGRLEAREKLQASERAFTVDDVIVVECENGESTFTRQSPE